MARCHSDRTCKKDLLSTEAVDPQHSRDGEDKFDDTNNSGSEKRSSVTAEFESLEDEWSVTVRWVCLLLDYTGGHSRIVVNGVDTVPLLEGHDQTLYSNVSIDNIGGWFYNNVQQQ